MNILRTFVYSPYVSISVGQVHRVQNQWSLLSLSSLHLWEWVCCRWRPVYAVAVMNTGFLETSICVPSSILSCLFSHFCSLLHPVKLPSVLPSSQAPSPVLPLSESLPKPLQSARTFLLLSKGDLGFFKICISYLEPWSFTFLLFVLLCMCLSGGSNR